MAVNESKEILNDVVLGNSDSSSILSQLFPEISSRISGFATIIKTIGIILLIYIILRIINLFFDIRRNIRITKTYNKVNEIDKKIDLLLGKKGLKQTDKKSSKQKSPKK